MSKDDPNKPADLIGAQAPTGTQSADTQQTHYVKVRATHPRGMWRGGIQWPQEETFDKLTHEQFEAVRKEPALIVEELTPGSLPEGKQAEADFKYEQRDPRLKKEREEEAKRLSFVGHGPSNDVAPELRPNLDPARVVKEPDASAAPPKHEDEPQRETVIGTAGTTSGSDPKRKK